MDVVEHCGRKLHRVTHKELKAGQVIYGVWTTHYDNDPRDWPWWGGVSLDSRRGWVYDGKDTVIRWDGRDPHVPDGMMTGDDPVYYVVEWTGPELREDIAGAEEVCL